MSEEPKVTSHVEGAVGWLVFSNPARLNAVTFEMWDSIPALVQSLVDDPAVRLLVLRGAGERAFVSGADISQFESQRGTADARALYEAASKRATAAIAGCPKPTVAMIHGYCVGGGLGLALCCDLRLASEASRFAIPAAKLGLGYGYDGVKQLTAVVGPAFAKEIFFTARQFTAAEAAGMGLVNRVVAPEALADLVADYAGRIAAGAPLTVRAAKLAVNVAASDAPGKDKGEVDRAVEACFGSEDYKEGRRAFIEKRRPSFRGR